MLDGYEAEIKHLIINGGLAAKQLGEQRENNKQRGSKVQSDIQINVAYHMDRNKNWQNPGWKEVNISKLILGQ